MIAPNPMICAIARPIRFYRNTIEMPLTMTVSLEGSSPCSIGAPASSCSRPLRAWPTKSTPSVTRAVAPHPPSGTNLRRAPTNRASRRQLPIAVTSVAGGRRSDLPDWTIMGMGTDPKSCSDVESPRTRVPACTFHANAMNQSALPAHPRAGSCVVIGESRGRASPGDDIAHGRSARNRVQYRVIRRMCLIIIG